MCLTIPGKVVALDGKFAVVDYAEFGTRSKVNVSMVKAKVGDYVLVHGGFVIRVLEERDAQESLKAWEMIRQELQESEGLT